MLNVLTPPQKNKTNQRGTKKPLEVRDMFVTLIVVMVTWEYMHVQTHQIVYILNMCIFLVFQLYLKNPVKIC